MRSQNMMLGFGAHNGFSRQDRVPLNPTYTTEDTLKRVETGPTGLNLFGLYEAQTSIYAGACSGDGKADLAGFTETGVLVLPSRIP